MADERQRSVNPRTSLAQSEFDPRLEEDHYRLEMRTVHGPRRNSSVPPAIGDTRSFKENERITEVGDEMVEEVFGVLRDEWKLLISELPKDGLDAKEPGTNQRGDQAVRNSGIQGHVPHARPFKKSSSCTASASDSLSGGESAEVLPAYAVALRYGRGLSENNKGKAVLDFGIPGEYKNSLAFERVLPGLLARQGLISAGGSPSGAKSAATSGERSEQTFSEGSTRDTSEPNYDFPHYGVIPENERDILQPQDTTERIVKWLRHVQLELGDQPPLTPPIAESNNNGQADWETLAEPATDSFVWSAQSEDQKSQTSLSDHGLLLGLNDNSDIDDSQSQSEIHEDQYGSSSDHEDDDTTEISLGDTFSKIQYPYEPSYSGLLYDLMLQDHPQLYPKMYVPWSRDADDDITCIDFSIEGRAAGLDIDPQYRHGPSFSNTDDGHNEIGKSCVRDDGGSDSDSSPWWAHADKADRSGSGIVSWDAGYLAVNKIPEEKEEDLLEPYEPKFHPVKFLPWGAIGERRPTRPKRPLRVPAPYFTLSDRDSEPELDSEEEPNISPVSPPNSPLAPPGSPESTVGDLNSNDSIFSRSDDGHEHSPTARRTAASADLGRNDDDRSALPFGQFRYGDSAVEMRLEMDKDEDERFLLVKTRAMLAGMNAGEHANYLDFQPHGLPFYAPLVEFAQFIEEKPIDDEEYISLTEWFRHSFKLGYNTFSESWPPRDRDRREYMKRKEQEHRERGGQRGWGVRQHYHNGFLCEKPHGMHRPPLPPLDLGGISPMIALEQWAERNKKEQAEREPLVRARSRAAGLIEGTDAYRKAAGIPPSMAIANWSYDTEVALPGGHDPGGKTDWYNLQLQPQVPEDEWYEPYPCGEDAGFPVDENQKAKLDQIFRETFNLAFEGVFKRGWHREGEGPRFAPKKKTVADMNN
ncbi:hypothetical protein GE09DRAFT_183179 [Coniochaeta sp. 2T2.1]|nr:hypothetical protein GE09DRAFT_183179 [Coniochaeta sp. 2T2.1]